MNTTISQSSSEESSTEPQNVNESTNLARESDGISDRAAEGMLI